MDPSYIAIQDFFELASMTRAEPISLGANAGQAHTARFVGVADGVKWVATDDVRPQPEKHEEGESGSNSVLASEERHPWVVPNWPSTAKPSQASSVVSPQKRPKPCD
jgi:hypothetical protein